MNPVGLAVVLALAMCHGPKQIVIHGACYHWMNGVAVYGNGTFVREGTPKCGQYQHFESEHHESCNDTQYLTYCAVDVPARCVDDIHMVTEREWQDLRTMLLEQEDRKNNPLGIVADPPRYQLDLPEFPLGPPATVAGPAVVEDQECVSELAHIEEDGRCHFNVRFGALLRDAKCALTNSDDGTPVVECSWKPTQRPKD